MNTMKIQNIIFVLIAVATFSCSEDRPKLGPPSSKLAGINDTWVLTGVEQLDENATRNNILDVSSVYIGSIPTEISFDSDSFTYVVIAGTSPNFMGDSGTWSFDDNNYPTLFTITHDGITERCSLNRTVRTVDQTLEFKYSRYCDPDLSKKTVSYNYTFTRK